MASTYRPVFAQSGATRTEDKPVPRIVSHTNLVLIPTVVTDKSGAHITGLTKDDFYVHENGQAQKITVFEEIHAEMASLK